MSQQEEEDGADMVEHDIKREDSSSESQSNFIRIDINNLKLQLEKQQKRSLRVLPNRMNSATQTDSPRRAPLETLSTSSKENSCTAVVNDPNVLTAWMSDDEKDMISRRVPK